MAIEGELARDLSVSVLECGGVSWVNIERPGLAEIRYLADRYGFHQLSLDDLLSVVQLPVSREIDLGHLLHPNIYGVRLSNGLSARNSGVSAKTAIHRAFSTGAEVRRVRHLE